MSWLDQVRYLKKTESFLLLSQKVVNKRGLVQFGSSPPLSGIHNFRPLVTLRDWKSNSYG